MIELDKLGKVVSCYTYKIAKTKDSMRFPVEFQYIGEDIEGKHHKGRMTLDSILYSDDDMRIYNTHVRFFPDYGDKKEQDIVLESSNFYDNISEYIRCASNACETNIKNTEGTVFPKEKTTCDYESAKNKVEETYDYTFNLENGVDFTIPVPKEYQTINLGNNIIITVDPKDGKVDTRYYVYKNKVFAMDFSVMSDIVYETYEFIDIDNPIVVTLDNMRFNAIQYLGCPNINILPTSITIGEETIEVEYDNDGIIVETSDNKSLLYMNKDIKLSLHPMYYDQFNTHLTYNDKLFAIDQFIDSIEDERFVYYTRLIVEVDNPDELITRIKDEESIRGIEFINYYKDIEKDDELTKEEVIEANTKHIKDRFGKKE